MAASRPAATQPAESCQLFRVVRGDLFIKVTKSGAWITLESPSGDKKHNCFNIIFDGDRMVTQVKEETRRHLQSQTDGATTIHDCRGRVLPTAAMKGRDQMSRDWRIEFDSKQGCNKASGIKDARTHAIANLDEAIPFIRLGNLT